LVLSAVAAGGLYAVLAFGVVPEEWRLGVTWAIVLVPSSAASIAMASAIRMLVVVNRQGRLLYVSTLSLLANGVLATLFFAWFGAVGIPVALLAVRGGTAIAYYLLTRNATLVGRAAHEQETNDEISQYVGL